MNCGPIQLQTQLLAFTEIWTNYLLSCRWRSQHLQLPLINYCEVFSHYADKNPTSFWLEMMQFEALVGHQISFITACWEPKSQSTNQKDKEPFVYKMKSASTKYKLLTWVGNLVGKTGIKGGRRNRWTSLSLKVWSGQHMLSGRRGCKFLRALIWCNILCLCHTTF